MKMADDLLACQKCVVTDVVNRDLDSDRCPDSVGISKFTSQAPALGLETRYWLAKQRLLRRVDDPRTNAIVGDAEILTIVVIGNRSSNPLGARVASDDANALTIRFQDWLNGAGIVELKEIAICGTGRKTRATRDTTAGNLHQERWIGRLTNANDSPLVACLICIAPPQYLRRSVGLRLQR
jgi:hypothetical protein